MTAERVSELLSGGKVFSLDAPLSEEEENTLGDIIETCGSETDEVTISN